MRIVINAVAVRAGGGETYLAHILKALCAAGGPYEFWAIVTPRHRSLLGSLPPGARGLVCASAPEAAWLRMVWEQTVLPVLLRRWKADLLFAAYNTAVLLSPAPVVLLAHNSNPYSRLPIPWSLYGRTRHAALRVLGRLSAKVAETVIFVSHTSAKVMAPRMGVPASRVRVVHHGWAPPQHLGRPAAHPRPDLPERYILTVGDFQPHKNLQVLLEGFDRLASEDGYPGHLVIAGGRREMSAQYARQLLAIRDHLACRERLHFLGRVPPEVLFPLYGGAELFVFPSLEETFGLPLVEAMGAGTPVIASDWRLAPGGEAERFNVGPEICGEAAEFFNPTDAASLVGAMHRVLTNSTRREVLARMGPVRASEFSWDKAAASLLAIFEEAAASAAARGRR